ncbi:type 1 glutamine amidotransferase [Streptomyces sp. NPDC002386]
MAGGEVRGEYGDEFGSTVLTLLAPAARDPLFGGLPERPTAVENRVDAIVRLPSGASPPARGERCPHQAFRLGRSAWGVQFHPEADPEQMRAGRRSACPGTASTGTNCSGRPGRPIPPPPRCGARWRCASRGWCGSTPRRRPADGARARDRCAVTGPGVRSPRQ